MDRDHVLHKTYFVPQRNLGRKLTCTSASCEDTLFRAKETKRHVQKSWGTEDGQLAFTYLLPIYPETTALSTEGLEV